MFSGEIHQEDDMGRYDSEPTRGSRSKIPVTEREFLWVQDDDKGEVILHVGPTMVSPTAADRVVADDGKGGFIESHATRPQRMIEVADNQYAVLHNPLLDPENDTPNGPFRPNRNESRPLRNGTRAMIPGPCSFYLRPGQRVEVRDAHELASNQYLVVKVYGEVSRAAPYFEITARSSRITSATVEDDATAHDIDPDSIRLSRGQVIVIRGLDTQLYIPPTGVDVVPDLSTNREGRKITAEAARRILEKLPLPPPPTEEAAADAAPASAEEVQLMEEIQQQSAEPVTSKRASSPRRQGAVEQSARRRQRVQSPEQKAPAAPEPRPEGIAAGDVAALLASPIHRQALEREVRKGRLIREAVVLGEKEYCTILDADGKQQIKVGPARVFPGPYDTFLTEGSNNRIYYAYELLPQRGLWLRFIRQISREKLEQKLPRGVVLDQEVYFPGDEMLLTGVNSFFFPFNEIEVLHPLNGQPHSGNDHSDVFIEAIGIDQKSGIYVRDLETGEARLVRGKRSYLIDPRKEVHITRTMPVESWNLWIAANEAHKATRHPIETPWALSVTVPPNTAVLAAASDSYRVIEGPCVALLEYEETLVPLTLSTGRPKSDKETVKTCYLRTVGNRVRDIVQVQTADFVELQITVSYQVTFDPTLKDRWFTHDNYVGVLCDHLRSLGRSRIRQVTLTELWPTIPSVIRDTILGERTEAGRKGRLFEENGMRVQEVEVLSSTILDREIAVLLETVQRERVSLLISDRQADEQLKSEKLRHEIERQKLEMVQEARSRRATLDKLIDGLEHERAMLSLTNKERAAAEELRLTAERLAAEQDAQLTRDRQSLEAHLLALSEQAVTESAADKERHSAVEAHEAAMAKIRTAELAACSAATVAERKAVQPALVEALTGLGDKRLLEEVARNMNLISLFKGEDAASILQQVVGGSKLSRTIAELLPKSDES
ncbi:MAG: major vault protein [Myxococcota bacterium]